MFLNFRQDQKRNGPLLPSTASLTMIPFSTWQLVVLPTTFLLNYSVSVLLQVNIHLYFVMQLAVCTKKTLRKS